MNEPLSSSPTSGPNPEGTLSTALPSQDVQHLLAHPERRTLVHFQNGNLRLAGHLYRPPHASEQTRTPGVVMVGPLSSVKEQTLPHYAERLSDAGYTVLTFDPRNFGESEGEPRFHHDPSEITADCSSAVGYLRTRADVDPQRIAVVGVCVGGGYAVSTAARDKRVAAVVSVAGGFNIGGTFQMFMGVDGFAGYFRQVNDAVQKQRETGEIQYIPTVSAEGVSKEVPMAVMPTGEAAGYYLWTHAQDAPNWSPVMTAASLEPFFIYNGLAHVPLIGHTPLLVVHGTQDMFTLPAFAQAAYDAALGPKELVWIETSNHVELYDQDPYVSEACGHIVGFLERFLAPAPV